MLHVITRLNNFHFNYPTIDRISDVNTSILLLHGENDNKVPPSMSVSLFNRFIQSRSSLSSSSSSSLTVSTNDQPHGYSSIDSSVRDDNLIVYPCTINNATCFYSDKSSGGRRSSTGSSSGSDDDDDDDDDDDKCFDIIHYYKLPLSSHNDNHRSQQWSHVIAQFFKYIENC